MALSPALPSDTHRVRSSSFAETLAPSEPGQSTIDPALTRGMYEEMLRVQTRQLTKAPVAVFLVSAVIAGLAAESLWTPLAIAWMLLVMATIALRLVLFPKLPHWHHVDIFKRMRMVTIVHIVTGSTLGLSLLFFPAMPEYERAIQSMLLVALCAGAVSTNMGFLPNVLGYIIPILVPLSVLWIAAAGGGTRWVEWATAGLVTFLIFILVTLSRDAFRLFRESYGIRFQQSETNAKLIAALDKAEEANRAKTRFLASASHDLRQPIHTLAIYMDLLTTRPLDDRSKSIVQNVTGAVRALSSELDSLLDISKLDAGLVQVHHKPLALRPLLERVCDSFEIASKEKDLSLQLECANEIYVHTDKTHFERVIRNLVENAIRYTDRGTITIAATRQRDDIVLRVSDTGRGIPELEHEKIFEEFYQVDNPERDRSKGLGLGLAIVRRLVELLGIPLELESKPGHGTQFILSIPASRHDATAAANGTALRAHDLNGVHVLIIDDEATIRNAMRELLETRGCHVNDADGTASAIERIRNFQPDIVLADFRLRGPDNGIASIRAVRERYPETPALLVSGDTAPERLLEADAAGVVLMHKPVEVPALISAIARSVGR